MYSAYTLNKQGDNMQPWRTPFPIWNQSVVPCPVLTIPSWPAYRFLTRQVRFCYAHLFQNFPQFVVIYTIKGFDVINKAEVDVFLEFSCFFYDPTNVGNLISASSAFSKSSSFLNTHHYWLPFLNPAWTSGSSRFTYCWSLAWRILSITLLAWDECNCAVVWIFFGIVFL